MTQSAPNDGEDLKQLREFPVILLESWRFPTRIAEGTLRRNPILISEFGGGLGVRC
jgi:hypothetical protein